jgi:hypothetical protein
MLLTLKHREAKRGAAMIKTGEQYRGSIREAHTRYIDGSAMTGLESNRLSEGDSHDS